jgi:hypothetical protein
MTANSPNGNGTELLVVGTTGGITFVDPSTPLKRLNYFDGKFLRAGDMDVEQTYLRQLVAISNQGLGAGVVYGYDTVLASGDQIQIGPGLAIDPAGKVLLLQHAVSRGIGELIEASKRQVLARAPDSSGKAGADVFSDCIEVVAPPPTAIVPVGDIYVIAICAAEALCGSEDVYGKLCEQACITSTDRPYRLDGIVVRAIPLQLVTPFPVSKAVAIDSNVYLRSKVAHSYYADEVLKHPAAISRDGLLSSTWCLGAGYDSSCCEVPLAVVARSGATTIFLDSWIVRRERIETPPRRYWQWKMRMRPWDVFLAQVLQFQCQLSDVLSGFAGSAAADPCASHVQALGDAVKFIDEIRAGYATATASAANGAAAAAADARAMLPGLSFTKLADMKSKFEAVLKASAMLPKATDRILIRGGIIELPSAGYLPIVNGTIQSVNDQVRALLGEGLDLRFCVVTADYVAHALEEAQHMDRISLTEGLDDPTHKPKVDILVPDGTIAGSGVSPAAGLFDAALTFSSQQTGGLAYTGAAREAALAAGGSALYSAGVGLSQRVAGKLTELLSPLVRAGGPLKLDLTPNLATNAFVKVDPKVAPNFTTRLANVVGLARNRIASAGAPAAETNFTEVGASVPAAPVPTDTVDGYWLMARGDADIKSLAAPNQTQVSGRVILAQSSQTPQAVEIAYHGALTVQSTSADGSVVNAAANLIFTVALIQTAPAQEREAEQILTQRVNWQVKLTYLGDDQTGSTTVDVTEAGQAQAFLRVVRTVSGGTAETYEVSLFSSSGNAFVSLAKLALSADAGILQPQNPNHTHAEQGLVLAQAAILETDPEFRKAAEAQLFPALPPATTELTIQALRDWVLFIRRREKQCGTDAPVAPVLPKTYRIFNAIAKNAEDAKQNIVPQLQAAFADPTKTADLVKSLIARQQREGHGLVVTFAGDSAQALFDPAAADADWKLLHPGNAIFFVAAGAKGDTDGALQLSRVRTFESAISADSTEDSGAVRFPIVPLPADATPPDADGIMVFLTAPTGTKVPVFVITNRDAWARLVQSLPTASQDQLSGQMAASAKLAGTVSFSGGTANLADNSAADLAAALRAQHLLIEGIAIWAKAGDPNLALYGQQALALKAALGNVIAPNVLPSHPGSQADVPAPGPAIILLLGHAVVTRDALAIVAAVRGDRHAFTRNAPNTKFSFSDATPQGTALQDFINAFPAGRQVRSVALFTTGALDAQATARQSAVFDAFKAANRTAATANAAASQPPQLSQADRDALTRSGFDLTGVDDVIMLG